jgi:hypothetical protein
MERVTVSNWDNTVQQRPMPAKQGSYLKMRLPSFAATRDFRRKQPTAPPNSCTYIPQNCISRTPSPLLLICHYQPLPPLKYLKARSLQAPPIVTHIPPHLSLRPRNQSRPVQRRCVSRTPRPPTPGHIEQGAQKLDTIRKTGRL